MTTTTRIDFNSVYERDSISEDLRVIEFCTTLKNDSSTKLRVEISSKPHEILSFVYNLAFGPLDARGHINDKAELAHNDYSKVFSTIVLSAFNYLNANPSHFLGIDGSDNNRAHLYYRFIQRNFDYLNERFDMYGIKYFVRISRFGKAQYDNPFDFNDIQAATIKLEKGRALNEYEMYNYFTFTLKKAFN